MIKESKTINKHKDIILNWFKSGKQYSSGVVEGLNNKAKILFRNAYLFRIEKMAVMLLYHTIGESICVY